MRPQQQGAFVVRALDSSNLALRRKRSAFAVIKTLKSHLYRQNADDRNVVLTGKCARNNKSLGQKQLDVLKWY
jgi:hypothetical protein